MQAHTHVYHEVMWTNITAIPYRASTGPEQGFPCEVFHTGKNLFSSKGTPVLIAGTPVFITGISLWENFTGKTLFSLQGMGLQCRIWVVYLSRLSNNTNLCSLPLLIAKCTKVFATILMHTYLTKNYITYVHLRSYSGLIIRVPIIKWFRFSQYIRIRELKIW